MTALATLAQTLELDIQAQNLLFREARTASRFLSDPVSDEQLEAIYDLVKYAPTSMNTQPLRMVVLRSEQARSRLLAHMAEGNKAKTAAAPLTVILAGDVEFHEELPRVFPHAPGAKAIFADDELREKTARFNAALQVGYFILGVRAAGLAAGPMTGFDADAVNQEFFADGEHRALAVVNLGTPAADAWLDRLPRLDYDDVVTTI
jgi:3-hydroxypropanoate dehydrogenase